MIQSFCFADCLAKMKRTRTIDSWFKPVTATENPNDRAVEPDEMQAPPEPAENAPEPLETEQARVLTTPLRGT
jgi:hypothetical protein